MFKTDLTFFDAQNIISIKLILILFLVFALISVLTRKIKPWQFLLGSGLLMGAGYYFLVKNLQLPFWGLQGDELTIGAIYNTFSQFSFSSDFAYHNLPPFYPPLFFWIIALIGKLLSLSAVGMIKLSALLTFAFFPVIFYFIQKLYWRNNDKLKNLEVAMLTSPLLIMLFVNIDEIFGKPYELFTAAAAIYWLIFFYLEIKKPKLSLIKIIIFGITGAIIFMTYYLWMIFVVIALALVGLTIKKEEQWKFFITSFKVLALTIILSLPFLLPLILSYAKYGAENWQTSFFTLDNINWRTLFFEKLDWKTLLMFLGFASIVYNYKDDKFKPLIAALFTAYLWWFLGLITLKFFQVPMQEFRGFHYFMPTILAIGLSFGLAQAWPLLDNLKNEKAIKLTIIISGILLFANYSILGSFVDDPVVRNRLIESKQIPSRFEDIINYLKNHRSETITLNTVPELITFVPINNFIYFNQQNSHPAANFSERLQSVKEMAASQNSEIFFKKTQTTPFGKINRLILYRDEQSNQYYLFYHLDKMMTGIEENAINFPVNLISEKYFKLTYKNNGYEIWETK